MNRTTVVFVVVTVAAVLAVAGWSGLREKVRPAEPSKAVGHKSVQKPEDVIRYWTPERMRRAKPA